MWSRTFLVSCFAATASLCVCAPKDGSPDGVVGTQKQPGGSIPSVSNGKSTQMCKKYAESVFAKVGIPFGDVTTVDLCQHVEPLIVGGASAQQREFPHMALIGFPANNKDGKKWVCGGSLISERFVLGVAHCSSVNKVRAKWVRLGEYNYKSTKDDEENSARPVDFEITEIIIHPEYDTEKIYNDIALYKLDRNVEFSEYVRPICLHVEPKLPSNFYTVSGWWSVEFGYPPEGVLLKSNVSLVPVNECNTLLKSALGVRKNEIRDETMLCAATFVDASGICQGSSGTPMEYTLSDPYCMYSQVGISSTGTKCGGVGEKKLPDIYTRVSYFVPWIEKIVWP